MSDWIDGDVDDGRQVAIGKNLRQQTTIRRDTEAWREFVRRDLESYGKYIMGLLGAVVILFMLGAILGVLAIRQFDLTHQRIERLERMERQRFYVPEYYYPGVPTP